MKNQYDKPLLWSLDRCEICELVGDFPDGESWKLDDGITYCEECFRNKCYSEYEKEREELERRPVREDIWDDYNSRFGKDI